MATQADFQSLRRVRETAESGLPITCQGEITRLCGVLSLLSLFLSNRTMPAGAAKRAQA